MELQLYFHNKELELLPETFFEYLSSDEKLIDSIEGLSDIKYVSESKDLRREGTKFQITFNGQTYLGKVTKHVENRRLEFTIYGFDFLLHTMINVVPVESRSELVISSDVETSNLGTYIRFVGRKLFVTQQFNNILKPLY